MQVLFDVAVPMRDDTALVADIQLPDGPGPFPALLQRVPQDRGAPAIRDGALDTVKAARHGYAVVTQDCRGRFGSAGEFTPFLAEADDGVDTVAWIRSQPWSDGRVGMFGRSYSAFVQWQGAARPPVPPLRPGAGRGAPPRGAARHRADVLRGRAGGRLVRPRPHPRVGLSG